MIKVNLLQTAPEPEQRAIVQKATAATQTFLLVLLGIIATVVALGGDYYYWRNQNHVAEAQVQKEEAVAREYAQLAERGRQLQQQKQSIDDRINIIKQLKSDQSGPVNMLSRINERLPVEPGLYLLLVKEKGKQVGIFGSSTSEETITAFARRIEQSHGLFSDVEIITINPAKFSSRDKLVGHITELLSEMDVSSFNIEQIAGVGASEGSMPSGILFAIKCKYSPGSENAQTPGKNVAANTSGRDAVAALR